VEWVAAKATAVVNHGSASDTFCLMTSDLIYPGRAGQIINQMMRDSSRHVDIIIHLPPDTATNTVGVRGGVDVHVGTSYSGRLPAGHNCDHRKPTGM
jgi:hypothetical protein